MVLAIVLLVVALLCVVSVLRQVKFKTILHLHFLQLLPLVLVSFQL